MAEREVRYCMTADGVRIAYCAEGEGPALMVCPITAFESFSLNYLMPELEDFYREIGAGRTLVYYDMRGTGLSERRIEDFSLEAVVSDVSAVADAAGLDRFAIWSPGLSGPKAIKYAAQNPDRLCALIVYGTFARALDAYSRAAIQAFAALALSDWELFCRTIADLGAARVEAGDAPLRAANQAAQSADGQTIARWIRQNEALDVTPYLAEISVRTLVVHRIAHSIFPIALGQALAAGIPGARLVTPPGAMAGYMWGDVKAITDAINVFLDEDPETRALTAAPPAALVSDSAFRTAVFTDVVENTALLRRIGDEAWRAVMREHEGIVRAALKEHGGTEISTSGDGFFASFGSSVRALQCAVEMQRAFARRNETAEHPVEVRIGLNAGEPIEEGREVLGTAVTLAARIMSQAGAGEVLVSDVVRQLVAGKGFLFADRGEFVAKGFEEPVRVYEVRWRE